MLREEIISALEPSTSYGRAFSAAKRTKPRRAPAPLVFHVELPYRQSDGPRLAWREDFGKGKGQVYSRDGSAPQRSCNEVEVAKRLIRVRRHARWISSYSPSQLPELWRPWALGPNDAPQWLRELDHQIRRLTGRATGGIPDVIAWNDDQDPLASALFVECKGAAEAFKEGQEDWVSAAIVCGVQSEQIAVAIRQFI